MATTTTPDTPTPAAAAEQLDKEQRRLLDTTHELALAVVQLGDQVKGLARKADAAELRCYQALRLLPVMILGILLTVNQGLFELARVWGWAWLTRLTDVLSVVLAVAVVGVLVLLRRIGRPRR